MSDFDVVMRNPQAGIEMPCGAFGRQFAVVTRGIAALDVGIKFASIDCTVPTEKALTTDARLGLIGLEELPAEHVAILAVVGVLAVRELERMEQQLYRSDVEEALVEPLMAGNLPVTECQKWIKTNYGRPNYIVDGLVGHHRETWESFVLRIMEDVPACRGIRIQTPLIHDRDWESGV